MHLGIDTRLTLLAAGLIFLLSLALGVWKYRQMAISENHLAHPYVDIAHRAALLYSFATLLIATMLLLTLWLNWKLDMLPKHDVKQETAPAAVSTRP